MFPLLRSSRLPFCVHRQQGGKVLQAAGQGSRHFKFYLQPFCIIFELSGVCPTSIRLNLNDESLSQ